MKISSSEVCVIAGMRKTGKTMLAKFLADQMRRKDIDVYVFDPCAEYDGYNRYIPKSAFDIRELDQVCKEIWQKGNTFFVIDEAEAYIKEKGFLPPYVSLIILRGRHRAIGLCVITRRIALLNKNVFALADHLFLFKFFAPNDLRYLGEFLDKETLEQVPKLPSYHYIYYHEGKSQIFKPIPI